MDTWFETLRQELTGPLPGTEAQLQMAPSPIRMPGKEIPPAKGSVMILLYPFRKEVCIVFIKRATYDGVHSGQISFPGGMHESGDESGFATALRETEEEIGIPRNSMTVIGKLTSLHIPVSNVDVLPVVSVMESKPCYVPDPNEVEFIIEARMTDLIHPATRKSKKLRVGDLDIEAPYYDVGGNHIWGATAMILSEFLEIVKKIYLVKL